MSSTTFPCVNPGGGIYFRMSVRFLTSRSRGNYHSRLSNFRKVCSQISERVLPCQRNPEKGGRKFITYPDSQVSDNTVRVDSLPHRTWREIKQQPGTAGPGNILGCCLIYFHFRWGKLSMLTVEASRGDPYSTPSNSSRRDWPPDPTFAILPF